MVDEGDDVVGFVGVGSSVAGEASTLKFVPSVESSRC